MPLTDGVPVRKNKIVATASEAFNNSLPSGRGHRRHKGGEELGVPERRNPLRRRSSLRSSSGVREIYAASPHGFQLGCDPAIWMRLYKWIETE